MCAAARRARSREKPGFKTGASTRNWAGYGAMVDIRHGGDLAKTLLTDPQTSGGLLLACEPSAVGEVLDTFRENEFDRAAVIGEIKSGAPLCR